MFSHKRTTYNLPEGEIVVFELLTRHDLAQCATVCKSWHAMVVSLIWRKIPELSSTQQASFRQMILEDYNQHVILQKLPLLDQHLFACEETMCKLDEAWEQLWQQAGEPVPGKQLAFKVQPAAAFFKSVPSAQYRLLEMQDNLWQDYYLHDLVRLVVLILTELNFANSEVDILDLRQILAVAKELTHLHVDICQIIYGEEDGVAPKIDDIPQFRAGLTTLIISTEDEDIHVEFWAGFWRDCPNVMSMHVGSAVPGLVEMLKKDVPVHLPRLNCLRMIRGSPPDSYEYFMSDDDIAALLMAKTEGWTVVETCPRAQLGPLGWSALSRHYSTLQELVLVPSSSSQILVDILASCPNLRILDTLRANNYARWPDFETRAVHAEHFIDGDKNETGNSFRPWACEATLQRLTVGITGLEMSDQGECSELRARLCGRLARFTRLE
ncbi:hypothetical protein BG006_003725, partial [Podila minutissima]